MTKIGALIFVLLLIIGQATRADEPLEVVFQDGHLTRISSVTFSPDGRILASSGGFDKTVKFWKVLDGSLIRTLEVHSCVTSIAFSPDGKILSSGSWDKTIKIWRVTDGSLIKVIKGHNSIVISVAFSPDGQLIVSASKDRTVKLWKVSDGSLIKTLKGHEGSVNSVAFSPDGRLIASGSDDRTLKLWKVSDGSLTTTLEPEGLVYVKAAFSPNGKMLASASLVTAKGYNYLITLLRVSDGSSIRTFGRQWNPFYSVAFSPDGRLLASGNMDSTIRLWRLSDGSLVKTLKQNNRPYHTPITFITFSPDGKTLASRNELELVLWDISEGSVIRTLENGTNIYPVAFSPDGKTLVTGIIGYPMLLQLWRISDGSLIKSLDRTEEFCALTSLIFSPDGKILASGSFFGMIELWNVSKGTLIRTLKVDKNPIRSMAFSPDGIILAAGSENGKVRLWQLTDGSLTKTLEGHRQWVPSKYDAQHISSVISLAFSPDGTTLASGGIDGAVKLWRITDGSLTKTLKRHQKYVAALAFSPNGKILTSAGDKLEIWNFVNKELVVTLLSVTRENSLALTPEGFFSGTGDFSMYVRFVKGLEVYDFNQFYDAFYRPDLVEKKLKGENISKYSGGLNIEDAIKTPPPKVTIVSPDDNTSSSERTITVKTLVKDTGGKIGDIRIYHNGKLVDSLGVYRLARTEAGGGPTKLSKAEMEKPYQTTRGIALRRVMGDADKKRIQEVEFTPAEGKIERAFKITLINGENTISMLAFNGTNTVMSAMESITIMADIPERKPELFALVMGNNHFKYSVRDLSLAVKDAKDFTETLKKVATPLYGKVHIKTLTDADKTSIVEAITDMKRKMKPEDVFIFFAATHGWAYDDRYYLYTTDFDGDRWSKGSSISSIELMEFSKWLPALKQVFILDTCHAGGMQAVVAGLYDARISVLAKALGMHVFAGAKTFQEAQDSYKGNGLFTYFVLNGLKGEADEDRNNEVSVFEMKPYLVRTVKEASKGKQEPFIRSFGDDLPLSKVIN